MFGSTKKTVQALEKQLDKAKAQKLITEALEEMEGVKDGAFMEAYILGLTEMALTLDAITINERSEYNTRAHEKERAIKAKGEPVYKKKGVYEYINYYILKDFAADNGAGSACWCIKRIGTDEIIAKDLTFKDAVKAIDEL